MADTERTFADARARLEDIVSEVRKKDMPLEASLDLLEEGVRLANACTEKIDQSEWRSVADEEENEPGPTDTRAEPVVADESGVAGRPDTYAMAAQRPTVEGDELSAVGDDEEPGPGVRQ